MTALFLIFGGLWGRFLFRSFRKIEKEDHPFPVLLSARRENKAVNLCRTFGFAVTCKNEDTYMMGKNCKMLGKNISAKDKRSLIPREVRTTKNDWKLPVFVLEYN